MSGPASEIPSLPGWLDRRRGFEEFYDRLDETAFKGAVLKAQAWAERERERIAVYIAFHYDHPFAPLIVGALSRAPEVLDVETAFTERQLAAGAIMLEAAKRDGIIPDHIVPELTIALMIGGIRQALVRALTSAQRPDPGKLANDIWAFMASALQLTTGPDVTPSGRNKVARRPAAAAGTRPR